MRGEDTYHLSFFNCPKDLFWVFLAFLLTNLLWSYYQTPIIFNGGKGWDGAVYFQMAAQLASEQSPTAVGPFVYRWATPLLVSLFFSNNLILGFQVINIIANTISVFLLLVYLRIFISSWKIRLILMLIFLGFWHAPVRFVWFYPVYTDPWSFVFLISGLITLSNFQKLNFKSTSLVPLVLALILAVGIPFRETVLILLGAFIFEKVIFIQKTRNPLKNIPFLEIILPTAAGILSLLLTHYFGKKVGNYSFIKTTLNFFFGKSLASYLLAWIITFGPIIFIPFLFWKNSIDFLLSKIHLVFYIAAFAVLGWIGGTDTERILFWSSPAVLVLIGKSIELKSCQLLFRGWFGSLFLVCQLLSMRFFWPIPNHPSATSTPFPIFQIISAKGDFLNLSSFHGSLKIKTIMLLEYVLLGLLTFWFFKRLKSRTPRPFQPSNDIS